VVSCVDSPCPFPPSATLMALSAETPHSLKFFIALDVL
jgi:hypothetical protein